jgi:hypothetical protein
VNIILWFWVQNIIIMAIDMIKVRAEIVLGSITAITPYQNSNAYILSFNVDKARGQISSFSCSLKVKSGTISNTITGDGIQISAGTSAGMNRIFTGVVRSANISPCREDPGFVILNLSGNDVLSRLQGKKYTRRCRSTKGVWVGIESVARPGLRAGKLTYTAREPNILTNGGALNQQDNLVKARSNIAAIHEHNIAKPPDQEQTISPNIEAVPRSIPDYGV